MERSQQNINNGVIYIERGLYKLEKNMIILMEMHRRHWLIERPLYLDERLIQFRSFFALYRYIMCNEFFWAHYSEISAESGVLGMVQTFMIAIFVSFHRNCYRNSFNCRWTVPRRNSSQCSATFMKKSGLHRARSPIRHISDEAVRGRYIGHWIETTNVKGTAMNENEFNQRFWPDVWLLKLCPIQTITGKWAIQCCIGHRWADMIEKSLNSRYNVVKETIQVLGQEESRWDDSRRR